MSDLSKVNIPLSVKMFSISILLFTLFTFLADIIAILSLNSTNVGEENYAPFPLFHNFIRLLIVVYVSNLIMTIPATGTSKDAFNYIVTASGAIIFTIYVFILLLNHLNVVIDSSNLGIPLSGTHYFFLILTLIIAYYFRKHEGDSAMERTLYAMGRFIEIIVVVIITVTFAYSELMFLLNLQPDALGGVMVQALLFALVSSATMLITLATILYGVETIINRTPSKQHEVYISIRRKTLLASSIVTVIILMMICLVKYPIFMTYAIQPVDLRGVFLLLAFVFLNTLLFSIPIGIYSGVSYTLSVVKKSSIPSSKVEFEKPVQVVESKPQTVPSSINEHPQSTVIEVKQEQSQHRIQEISSCPYCGRMLPQGARFCPYCGAFVQGEDGTRIYAGDLEEDK